MKNWKSIRKVIEKYNNYYKSQIALSFNWNSYFIWKESTKRFILDLKKSINESVLKSNKFTKKIISDFESINWSNFIPLRLSREEDYSDWLAFFIENSSTNYFINSLIKLEENINVQNVYRETPYLGYRSDLIIKFNNTKYCHIEVKIGDKNLLKTYDTALAMSEYYNIQNEDYFNFILLLPNQINDWNLINQEEWVYSIKSITWIDIVVAARKSIYYSSESLFWKTWFLGFIGAIEQILLNIPITDNVYYFNMSESILKFKILNGALNG